jgi:hypothetical protein
MQLTISCFRLHLAFIVLTTIVLNGCGQSGPGSTPPPLVATQLLRISLPYCLFCDTMKRPPTSLDELLPLLEQDNGETQRQVNAGNYVVVWNNRHAVGWKEGEPADSVIAYQKGALESGGFAVFIDGCVKWATPEQLKEAIKS